LLLLVLGAALLPSAAAASPLLSAPAAFARGLIVSQRPAPRRRLPANATVSVAVSLGGRR
jgi:hypothetical protein